MNILIPHTWLLEHLETQATPEQIQKFVSLSGPSIERIYEREGEPVYDIEVTTNRVDSMSVRGIAREAAVILTEAGFPSRLKKLSFPHSSDSLKVGNLSHNQKDAGLASMTNSLPLPKIINDPKLCKRILCVVIRDVEKVASPDWMQKRLRQVGINTHDAIIDISNYITHELGHPCHTFDYDKVMATGGKVIVKEATKGQKFSIIDGTQFETVGGEVVFENEAGEIIDLPAIKGTKNTAIGNETKNVLFWIESLDAKKVRFASMTHAIRTVAAQLNEKNVDPNLGKETLERGITLLCDLAKGTVASTIHDEYPGKSQPSAIRFQLSDITRYLGIEIPTERIIPILESLECKVEKSGDELVITPPTFRPDLEISADIVEEIARIYGYHRLPSTLMATAIPTNRPTDIDFDLEHDVKTLLSSLGAYEVYTYSLLDEAKKTIESEFVGSKEPTHVKLANPLTEDLVYLRRTLWASHAQVLAENPTPKEIVVFEFANVYLPVEDAREVDQKIRAQSSSKDRESSILPFEEFHLTLTGRVEERRIKGMLEAVCKKYYLPTLRYVQEKSETEILAGKTKIGYFTQFSTFNPSTSSGQVFQFSIVDIDWRMFLSLRRTYPVYVPESKYTPVTEDLTFTIPADQQIQRVMETMSNVIGVSSVSLSDVYKRNHTFALRYESDHQLTGDEVTGIRTQIIDRIQSQHQAILVGNV